MKTTTSSEATSGFYLIVGRGISQTAAIRVAESDPADWVAAAKAGLPVPDAEDRWVVSVDAAEVDESDLDRDHSVVGYSLVIEDEMSTTKDACAYCDREVTASDDVPALRDDEEWTARAVEHAPDCEWILTRAHRRDVPTKWQITSTTSGADLGSYEGEAATDALDVMAREAGYRDHADACEASGDDGSHLLATRVSE